MNNYKNVFKMLPLPCLLLKPRDGFFYIKDANERFFTLSGKTMEELSGMILPDVFPENPEQLGNSWKELHDSLKNVLLSGKSEKLDNFRYDLLIPCLNEFEESYWQMENIPIADEKTGVVNYILFIALDKTSEFLEHNHPTELTGELV